jgi:hypothetical protein
MFFLRPLRLCSQKIREGLLDISSNFWKGGRRSQVTCQSI